MCGGGGSRVGSRSSFCRSEHLTVKFKRKCEWLKIAQATLKQKSQVGGVALPDFELIIKL